MHMAHQTGRRENCRRFLRGCSARPGAALNGRALRLRGRAITSQEMRGLSLSRISPRGGSVNSRPRRRPERGVARLVDPDLHMSRTSPDAAGDDPAGQPREGQPGGVGGEDGRGWWRHVRHGGREPLVVDGNDGSLLGEATPGTTLATETAVLARLGVARFVQGSMLQSLLMEWRTPLRGRRPGSRCRRWRWRFIGWRLVLPTARPATS
jgi:hypothetical protein